MGGNESTLGASGNMSAKILTHDGFQDLVSRAKDMSVEVTICKDSSLRLTDKITGHQVLVNAPIENGDIRKMIAYAHEILDKKEKGARHDREGYVSYH